MNRFFVLAAIVTAFSFGRAVADEPKAPKWSALGLQIGRESPPDAQIGDGLADRLGTTVVGILYLPSQFIVGLNSTESKLEKFTDDKGTDLLQPRAIPQGGVLPRLPRLVHIGGIESRISPDGTYIKIPIDVPGHPAAGATKIRIKGTVAIDVGKDERFIEVKDGSLADGIDLKFGTLKLYTRPPGAAPAPVGRIPRAMVTWQGSQPLKDIVFLNKDGQEIKKRDSSAALSRTVPQIGNRPRQFHATMFLDGDVDRCTVKVRYFNVIEKIEVPLDMEFGLGLE